MIGSSSYLKNKPFPASRYPVESNNMSSGNEIVTACIANLRPDLVTRDITPNVRLIGHSGLLDSMRLVELCLALEDKADALGFQFDWTSDKAMSEHAGMFRTVESLAAEFDRQWRTAGSPGSSDRAGD